MIVLTILYFSLVIFTIFLLFTFFRYNHVQDKIINVTVTGKKPQSEQLQYRMKNNLEKRWIVYYYVFFTTNDGDVLEFRLPKSKYEVIEKGDQGKLTYKGSLFKSFQSDKIPEGIEMHRKAKKSKGDLWEEIEN